TSPTAKGATTSASSTTVPTSPGTVRYSPSSMLLAAGSVSAAVTVGQPIIASSAAQVAATSHKAAPRVRDAAMKADATQASQIDPATKVTPTPLSECARPNVYPA